jgi:transcription antitermination factor NusG
MRELYPNHTDRWNPGFSLVAPGQNPGDSLVVSWTKPLAPWHVLAVKHQHERAIQMGLAAKGFEAFSPTYRARRQWSDRVKTMELPLFPGYVFCRFAPADKIRVLDTPAVSRVVQFGGTLAAVPDVEIEAIRSVVASKLPVRPWLHLKPGDRVRIERGPLRGVVGVLLREKDDLELVVSIEILQRSVAVRIDAAAVVPQIPDLAAPRVYTRLSEQRSPRP